MANKIDEWSKQAGSLQRNDVNKVLGGPYDHHAGVNLNNQTVDMVPLKSSAKEHERAYIPTDIAQKQIDEMAAKMKAMNIKHQGMMEQVVSAYEAIQKDKHRLYLETIEDLKLKAVERLQLQKAAMNALEEEIKNVHELARKREQEWVKKQSQAQEKLEKLTSQRQTLLGKISQLEEEKLRLTNQSEHDRAQTLFLQKYRADSDSRVKRLDEESLRHEERMEELVEELQEIKNADRIRKKELKEVRYQLSQKITQLNSALEQIEQVETKARQVQEGDLKFGQLYQESEERLAKALENMKVLKKNLAKKGAELTQSQRRQDTLAKELQEAQELLTKAKTSPQVSSEHIAEIEVKSKELAQLQQEVMQLKSSLEAARSNSTGGPIADGLGVGGFAALSKEMETEIERLHTELEAREALLAQASRESGAGVSQEIHHAELQEKNLFIAEIEAKLSNLTQSLQAQTAREVSLKQEITEITRRLEDEHSHAMGAKDRALAAMGSEVAAARLKIEELTKLLDTGDSTAALGALQRQLQALEDDLRVKNLALANAFAQTERDKAQLRVCALRVADSKEELIDLEKQISQLPSFGGFEYRDVTLTSLVTERKLKAGSPDQKQTLPAVNKAALEAEASSEKERLTVALEALRQNLALQEQALHHAESMAYWGHGGNGLTSEEMALYEELALRLKINLPPNQPAEAHTFVLQLHELAELYAGNLELKSSLEKLKNDHKNLVEDTKAKRARLKAEPTPELAEEVKTLTAQVSTMQTKFAADKAELEAKEARRKELTTFFGVKELKIDGKYHLQTLAGRTDLRTFGDLAAKLTAYREAHPEIVTDETTPEITRMRNELAEKRDSLAREGAAGEQRLAALASADTTLSPPTGSSATAESEYEDVTREESRVVTKRTIVVDSSLSSRIAQLQSTIERKELHIAELSQRLAASAQSSDQAARPSSASTHAACERKLANAQKQLAATQEALRSLQAQPAVAQMSVATLANSAETKRLEEAGIRARAEMQALQIQVQSLSAQLSAVGGNADEAAKSEIANLKAEVAQLRQELSQLRTENEQLAKRPADDGGAATLDGSEVQRLRAELAASREGGAAQAGSSQASSAALSEAEKANATLSREMTELRARLTEVEAAYQKCSEQIATHTARISELEEEVKKKEKELDDLKKLSGKGAKEMKKAQEKMEADLKAEAAKTLAEKEAKAAVVLAEKEAKAAEELANLQRELEESEAKLEAAVKKRDASEKDARNLRRELDVEVEKRQAKERELVDLAEARAKEAEELKTWKANEGKRTEEVKAKMEAAVNELESTKTALATSQSALQARIERSAAVETFLLEEQKRRKKFQAELEELKGSVRVYARVRPFSKAEKKREVGTCVRSGNNAWTLELNRPKKDLHGSIVDDWTPFAFDGVFLYDRNGSQAQVFEECKLFAELSFSGVNCCIFAYGQSGTGKTFTMSGAIPYVNDELVGLKPRMVNYIFQMRDEAKLTHEVTVTCYMVEIYLNCVYDIFQKKEDIKARKKGEKPTEPEELKTFYDAKKGKVIITPINIQTFNDAASMNQYCDEAETLRRVRTTGLNDSSSRSHLIFAVEIQSRDLKTQKVTSGKLSLCDLAGSERVDKTNVEGLSATERAEMVKEGVKINESLAALKNVFRILGGAEEKDSKANAEKAGKEAKKVNKTLVQYRGNALTELMQDSLGGKARTLMFVNVGPAEDSTAESLDSLTYGTYVNNIRNEVATADQDFLAQIANLERQLKGYKEKFGEIS
jgi:chromosome segregation ATPase